MCFPTESGFASTACPKTADTRDEHPRPSSTRGRLHRLKAPYPRVLRQGQPIGAISRYPTMRRLVFLPLSEETHRGGKKAVRYAFSVCTSCLMVPRVAFRRFAASRTLGFGVRPRGGRKSDSTASFQEASSSHQLGWWS